MTRITPPHTPNMALRYLEQFYSTEGDLSLWGHWTMSGDNMLSQVGQWESATVIQWIEARDAAKHRAHIRQPPPTNNHPAQKANNAEEIEKPSSRLIAAQQRETGTSAS